MSGVRLYYIIRLYYITPGDRKFSIGYVTSAVEINLAIITASVPALWPLARRWFPGAFESLGIDRPYLEPDIEVAYAHQSHLKSTARGSLPRRLRGKVMWQKKTRVPSCVLSSQSGGGTDHGAAVGVLSQEKPALHVSVSHATESSGRRSSNSSRNNKDSWLDDGDDDEDDDGMTEMTYHHHIRVTEAELRSPSV